MTLSIMTCFVCGWHISADEENDHEVHHELIAVFSNGTMKWIPSMIYKSGCVVDMANFPFDKQTCLFKFGSWAYDGGKVTVIRETRIIKYVCKMLTYYLYDCR